MLFACSPMYSATIMQRAVQGMRSASLSWGGFPGRNVLRPHQVHVFYRRLLLLFLFLFSVLLVFAIASQCCLYSV